MAKVKIIFENPETRGRDFFILDDSEPKQDNGFKQSEFSRWKDLYENTQKTTDFLPIPRYGKIQKSSIKAFIELKPAKEKEELKPTRYETNPPSPDQWKRIQDYLKGYFSWRCGTPLIFEAACKSVWNWDNEITKEALGE